MPSRMRILRGTRLAWMEDERGQSVSGAESRRLWFMANYYYLSNHLHGDQCEYVRGSAKTFWLVNGGWYVQLSAQLRRYMAISIFAISNYEGFIPFHIHWHTSGISGPSRSPVFLIVQLEMTCLSSLKYSIWIFVWIIPTAHTTIRSGRNLVAHLMVLRTFNKVHINLKSHYVNYKNISWLASN